MDAYPPIPEIHKLSNTLYHNDLAPFIKPWIKKLNPYTFMYKALNFIGLLVVGGLVGIMLSQGQLIDAYISGVTFGVLVSFLLIPLHEYIHGLAYKFVGAKKVTYRAYWKKLVFYAIADRFAIGFDKFRIVALAPFVVITFLCLMLIFIFPTYWVFFFSVAISHNAFCGGDFGLLSFMYEHRNQDILTVDDITNEKTYFYSQLT